MNPFPLSVLLLCLLSTSTGAQSNKWLFFSKNDLVEDIDESPNHILISDKSGITRINKINGEKTFWNSETTPIPNYRQTTLMVNEDGAQWFIRRKHSILRYQNGEWEKNYLNTTPLTQDYTATGIDDVGNLWICDTALFAFDGQVWSSYRFPAHSYEFKIDHLKAVGRKVWMATNEGLFLFEEGDWQVFPYPTNKTKDRCSAIEIDSNGNPWILYGDVLYYFDGGQIKAFATPEVSNDYTCLNVIDKTHLWLGIGRTDHNSDEPFESGAYHFYQNSWTFYDIENSSLSLYEVRSIHTDSEQHVWFGGLALPGRSHAVVKKNGDSWEVIEHSRTPIVGGSILKVMAYPGGVAMLYRGDYHRKSNGIITYSNGRWTQLTGQVKGTNVPGAFTDTDGTVYIKNGDKIRLYGPTGVDSIEYPKKDWYSNEAQRATEITMDKDRNIWVDYVSKQFIDRGTIYSVARFDGEQWQLFRQEEYFPDAIVHSLGLDRSGNFHMISGQVFYTYNGEGFEKITECPPELQRYSTIDFGQDENGNFWFPSPSVDLFRFDGTQWHKYYNKLDNAQANDFEMAIAPSNDVFLRQGNHFSRFDGTQWTDLFMEETPMEHLNIYSMDHDDHGNIWLGSDLGVLVYNENGIDLPSEEPLKQGEISLYPNPIHREVHLRLPNYYEALHLEVFNLMGQKVLTNTYFKSDAIDLYDLRLSNNMYFFRVETSDGSVFIARGLVTNRE